MAVFNPAINIVLKHEGGYVDDPDDKGGETKFGISKARFPDVDIMNLTLEDAKEIYKKEYWLKNNLQKIKSQPIANFALDTVIHHGYGPKLIQKAVNASGGNIAVDGRIGPLTIKAINSLPSSGLFLMKGVEIRKQYMRDLIKNTPSNKKFEKGWLARAGFFSPKGGAGNLGRLALVSFFIWKFLGRKS